MATPAWLALHKQRLTTQIQLGFAALLLLLIVLGTVAWQAMGDARGGFTTYRGLARETNASSQLQVELAQARIQAVYFLWRNDSVSLERFRAEWQEMADVLRGAEELVQDPERAATMAGIGRLAATYDENFNRCAELVLASQALRQKALPEARGQLIHALEGLLEGALDAGQTEAVKQVVNAIEATQSTWPQLQRACDSRAKEDMEAAAAALTALQEEVESIVGTLGVHAQPQTVRAARIASADLRRDTRAVLDNLQEQDRITRDILYAAGVQIAADAEGIKSAVRTAQDELGPALQAELQQAESKVTTLAIVTVLLGIALCWLLTRPVRAIVEHFRGIANAEGNLTWRLPEEGNRDMVELAQQFNQFVAQVQRMVQSIGARAEELNQGARELDQTAIGLEAASRQAQAQSSQAGASAGEVGNSMAESHRLISELAEGVRVGAAAVQEMTASITDVAEAADKSLEIATRADRMSTESNQQIQNLEEAAREIGEVVSTIEEIAEQTNLLALNATIEAARAGDSGRGFAVVAGEVKELARQTAEATHGIRERVQNIQGTSRTAAESVRHITEVIQDVNRHSGQIAGAVGEQRSATGEIASTLSRTSEAADSVVQQVNVSNSASGAIREAMQNLDETNRDVSDRAGSATRLGEQLVQVSDALQQAIGAFKY